MRAMEGGQAILIQEILLIYNEISPVTIHTKTYLSFPI